MAPLWTLLAEVGSEMSDRTYRVSIKSCMGCNCPAWTRTVPRADCKHIRAMKVVMEHGMTNTRVTLTEAGGRWARAQGWNVTLADRKRAVRTKAAAKKKLAEEQRVERVNQKIKDGKQKRTKSTIIKEIQHDFLKGDVLHIDFNEISLTKKIHTHIPVVTVGDNIGEHHGGILEHTMRELEISCLAADLPAEVVVNVENLDMNQSIHVRDIDLGSKVEILNDPAQTVITVTMPKKVVEEEELEELVEEAAEPEVIGEKEKAAEEEQQKS